MERGNRKCIVGVVVSDRMDKTRRVEVQRLMIHPKFKKYLKRYSRCYVDDPKNESALGDHVEIMETRPLSRLKRWRLVRIVRRAKISAADVAAAGGKPVSAETEPVH